ncbi:Peptidoglycan/LPS O-acetylase OafA/YrhL, contains acyltransferase and SGNH-hydrolase domains [Thiothrix eikelboomii]|uniref:Peptidoglycan/LPS O-acetylase OafA/YrhL, contains acyltransferase and SGNH-hydrolase domains n=1 Tax=Thiothrix eikelboomii TaxID=92487 RepID=A0A1T4Y4Z8_9GAMM|nr:acyltransferase [Thiothrix eikelboomii]SKA96401.1 Peptidoglycan/LPS O-acetylase OafA/YrhL, contains acyltransferase and SGNH-hydrolase domains [Thiothrix eikelboomii]
MHYRTEIDGLRALAVLPVIAYHAGLAGFSGGFVGVDIFFVISGYLITSILLDELKNQSFTLLGFYERRIRRILPALFLVLAVTAAAAWWLLLPHELAAFGRSLMAVSVFASNILFWKESDYFATESEFIPLLHTWSLAVEEQYYVIFPLLLAFLWKFGRQPIGWVLGGLTLLGLVTCEWLWRVDAGANFYLLPSRFWELLLGALAALYLNKQTPFQGWITSVLAVLGLVLILGSIIFLNTSLPFPSRYALFPTLGATLIILFAAPTNFIGRLLAFKPLVLIGLISYSAYLWHQPLLVFARLQPYLEPNLGLMTAMAFSSLLLAWLSWRYVERPFRHKQTLTRPQIFSLAGLGSLLFLGLGYGLAQAN